VRTREQRTMDKTRLKWLFIEQKAQQFHLPMAGNKKSLVEAIMVFLEKNDTSSTDEYRLPAKRKRPLEKRYSWFSSVNGIQQQKEAQRQQEQFLKRQ